MTASQPLFCLNVNLSLVNQGGSIHDVPGEGQIFDEVADYGHTSVDWFLGLKPPIVTNNLSESTSAH